MFSHIVSCWCTPKPPLRDGSPGGLWFVWDGRSVNSTIKTDSFLIPRVEDLIERIVRLKDEVNTKGITEMWISTLDLRTSFWQLNLDEASRPLTSFRTTPDTYQWTCVPMGLLTARLLTKSTRFSWYGCWNVWMCIIWKCRLPSVISFTMRHHFLDLSFGLMTYFLRIPKFRLLRIGHPSPTFEVYVHSCLCVLIIVNTFGDFLRLLFLWRTCSWMVGDVLLLIQMFLLS